MNVTPEIPPHVKLAQEKAEWDAKQQAKKKSQKNVTITAIDIPFTNLVIFLVKLAIAAVPAAIIVSIFWMLIAAFIFGGATR